MHSLVAIVTLLALILYFIMGLRVGQARSQFKIDAPAIHGHPDFERVFRVQANTLEWLPIFLTSLWLFTLAWDVGGSNIGDMVGALTGVVWIVGRILYMTGYSKEASARSMGFGVQALATAVLLFGALGKIIYVAISTHTL